ncbi:MAG: signal peptidase I [Candidatus Eisenbacteria bacterium]|nr:signal peptidase I [Candidatus Eisenbacteria bacterium]
MRLELSAMGTHTLHLKEMEMKKASSAERRGSFRIPRTKQEWAAEGLDWIKSIAVVLAIFLPIMTFVVQGYRIPSGSMEDTLLIGDFLFADKVTYGARVPFLAPARVPGFRRPEPGDIVIFKSPETGETLIKRCVAIGGQTVEMRNKVLFIDDEAQQEEYVKHIDPRVNPRTHPGRDSWGPLVVPQGHLLMLGDNRDASRDSRFFGTVPFELVIAKADILYFSFDKDKFLPRIWRIGKLL